MKHLAILLAFMVVWLSVIPQSVEYCQASIEESASCCSGDHCQTNNPENPDTEQKSRKDSGGCCPGGVCSPFQTCASCFLLQATIFQLPAPLIAFQRLEKVPFGYLSRVSTFIGDFFQPPEMMI